MRFGRNGCFLGECTHKAFVKLGLWTQQCRTEPTIRVNALIHYFLSGCMVDDNEGKLPIKTEFCDINSFNTINHIKRHM